MRSSFTLLCGIAALLSLTSANAIAQQAELPVQLSGELTIAGQSRDGLLNSALLGGSPQRKITLRFDTEQEGRFSDRFGEGYLKDVSTTVLDKDGKAGIEYAFIYGEVSSGLTLSLSAVADVDGSALVTVNYELVDLLGLEQKCLNDECSLWVETPRLTGHSAAATIVVPPKAKGRASIVELPGGAMLKLVTI